MSEFGPIGEIQFAVSRKGGRFPNPWRWFLVIPTFCFALAALVSPLYALAANLNYPPVLTFVAWNLHLGSAFIAGAWVAPFYRWLSLPLLFWFAAFFGWGFSLEFSKTKFWEFLIFQCPKALPAAILAVIVVWILERQRKQIAKPNKA